MFGFVALDSMSNSRATNEYTITCGRCDKLKIVPTDRTPQAKEQYFKKSEWLLKFVDCVELNAFIAIRKEINRHHHSLWTNRNAVLSVKCLNPFLSKRFPIDE